MTPEEATVLLIEDDVYTATATLDLLKLAGVGYATTRIFARHALDLGERLPRVDLILLDLNLLGEHGYDVLSRIRAHPTIGKTARVVAFTAQREARESARRLGFDGFISKPVNPPQFVQQIRSILAGESVWDD